MATILVVDDEAEIRAFLRLLLEEEGYQVETAANGLKAVEQAIARPPDLVLTDWAMPFFGGDDLRARLQSGKQTCQIPIILMTAFPSHPSEGYAAFLAKPFDLDALLALIRGCLAKRSVSHMAKPRLRSLSGIHSS